MTRLLLSLLFGSFAFAPAVGSEPSAKIDPNPASLEVPADIELKARHLVRQLGDREYETREDAQQALRDLGRLALPALQDGFENSDSLEAAERCDQLLPRARGLDIRARVDCFVADAEGKYDHKLPAAKEFFAVTGRTDPARKLFRDLMLSSNRDLLTTIGEPDEVVATKAVARRIDLYPRPTVAIGAVVESTRRQPPAALDIIGLLFAESTIPEKALTAASTGGGGVAVTSPTVLLTQPAFRTALESGPLKEPMAALAVKWFETRDEVRTVSLCMSTAATLKLPVSKALAKKVLDGKGFTPLNKAMALTNIAKVGDAADVALLAPLFKDESQVTAVVRVVNGVQQRDAIQMRDVALAMSLLLAKQDPTEFGMKARYAGNAAAETLRYSYLNYHFDDTDGDADDKRKAAFQKWDEWAAKNLKGTGKK